jgi:Uma2 family endonuclease
MALLEVSVERYLEIERGNEQRSEYFQGELRPMPASPVEHAQVACNVLYELHLQLEETTRRVFGIGLKVYVKPTRSFFYPDALVVEGDPQLMDAHEDAVLNPTVLIEVVAPKTDPFEYEKFRHYRKLDSLQEYLMLGSKRISAELYTRCPNGDWRFHVTERIDDIIELESVGCRLELARLYKRVDFSR